MRGRSVVLAAVVGMALGVVGWTFLRSGPSVPPAGAQLRPWPDGKGNPAVVVFLASHPGGGEFGTSAAFHVGDGLFVTCDHCLEDYERYEVLARSGDRAAVTRIAAWDPARDIAVVAVDHVPEGVGTLELSDRVLSREEGVAWCGFPAYVYREESFRMLAHWEVEGWGSLLALAGSTGAGTSGGPVVDASGRAVGMIFRSTFAAAPSAGHDPHTHAVSAREISRRVAEARTNLREQGSGRGVLPADEWVLREREPGRRLQSKVHALAWKKDLGGAADLVAKRLAERPRDAEAWALQAEIRRKQGDLGAAERAVDASLAADPGSLRGRFELGEVKLARKQTASALAAFESCARTKRDGWCFEDWILLCDAHSHRANLLMGQGRHGEAIAAYRDALAICPYEADEEWRMGDAHVVLGEARKALACYERSLALRPDYAPVLVRFAIARMQAGEAEGALEAARRAVSLDRSSPTGRFLAGYLSWKAGDVEEARAHEVALASLDGGLAARLAAHLEGLEQRPPSFHFETGGKVVVKPLP